MKILIVGCGFYGTVIARELANAGYNIYMIDKRNHIAGNCYDYTNEHGILVHKYGPHAFHTNNDKVVNWLKQFGEWFDFELKVDAQLENGKYLTFPLKKSEQDKWNDEDFINTFFKPYSEKMWNIKFDNIDKSIIDRIPRRNDDSEGYFPNDKYQMLPLGGYTKLFEKILDHKNISIQLNTPFNKNMEKYYDHVFNSMPIDEYFDFCYGELPYRSLKFHTVHLPSPKVIPNNTVNFTHTGPYTRMVEWKNWKNHGKNSHMTTLTYEEPCDYKDNNMERYYPVKDPDGININIYKKYKELTPSNVTFIGRTGMYVYFDMHMAISSALATAKRFI